MKKEIKERIEMINNGEVPEGYKETKLGIIPGEWDVKKLGDLIKEDGKYGINASACDYNEKLPRYLRITDITDDGRIDETKKASVDHKDIDKFYLNKDEIVFARTGATVGKSYLYNDKDGALVYAGYLIKFSINRKVLSPELLFYYSHSYEYWKWVKVMSMRSGQPGLNSKQYKKMKFILPDIKKQKQIANILTTWDEAIELKEKLLEKKKDIKKGLMQKLLTGEVRLEGFSGEWKKVKLGTLIENIDIKNTNNENFTVLTSSRQGIYDQKDYFNKNVSSKDLSNYKIISKGNFVYRKMTDDGFIKFNMLQNFDCGLVSSAYPVFNVIDANKWFIYYLINTHYFLGKTKRYIQGSTRKSLKYKDLKKILVKIPDVQEQNQIIKIINYSEKSINLLEKEIELLREEKKGLMQLLLTGKVRVNEINEEIFSEIN